MTEPIRVLHVVTIMNRGGLETMLMNYYRHIDRTKVQFDFWVHRAEQGAYDDEIRSMGGGSIVSRQCRLGVYVNIGVNLITFFHHIMNIKLSILTWIL